MLIILYASVERVGTDVNINRSASVKGVDNTVNIVIQHFPGIADRKCLKGWYSSMRIQRIRGMTIKNVVIKDSP